MISNKLPKHFIVSRCNIDGNEIKIYINNLNEDGNFSTVIDNSTQDVEIVGLYELKEIKDLVPKRKKKGIKMEVEYYSWAREMLDVKELPVGLYNYLGDLFLMLRKVNGNITSRQIVALAIMQWQNLEGNK